MKRLKKFWFVPFAVLAVVALVAASPTPRRLLSETFTNWIMIEGASSMIYHDTTTTSGGSVSATYYRDHDDTVSFSAGALLEDGHGESYSIRTGEYNGPLGIYVDTGGDVGIKTAPYSGMELDVNGDAWVREDLLVAGRIESHDDLIATDIYLKNVAASDGSSIDQSGFLIFSGSLQYVMFCENVLWSGDTWYDTEWSGAPYQYELNSGYLYTFKVLVTLVDEDSGNYGAYEIVGTLDGTTLDTSTVTTIYEDDSDFDVRALVADDELHIQYQHDGAYSGTAHAVVHVTLMYIIPYFS